MPPKKTETKTEGAPPMKSAAPHPSYQDMITDAIIAVLHPAPFLAAHLGLSVRSATHTRRAQS
ncbi:hypothetical protein N656DRAFT_780307 [Canariomyces notabilis]|uniref:Uncharacterized protein n=1 Tax=Canariomyces notabilis TaxID=2074819 RepID=A0AAN6YQP0_9PEZI|nr:hypothetical protein N656DRAFT_780307 [Canariomyces arenarius]